MAQDSSGAKRKEIYTYTAPWLIYGMNWSVRADQRFRLAIGSFEEEYSNSVRIIQLNEEKFEFEEVCSFEHPYPTTKIMWIPDPIGARRDLLATTGDYLRLWQVTDNKTVRLDCLLNNVRRAPPPTPARPGSRLAAPTWTPGYTHSAPAGLTPSPSPLAALQNKNTEFCAPLTSFDWNEADPNLIGTSSIDTTCTIWDITKMQASAHAMLLQWASRLAPAPSQASPALPQR